MNDKHSGFRILIILPNLDHGGTETAVMHYFRASGLAFDFVVHGEAGYFEPEAVSLGAKIFRVPTRSRGFFKNIAAMRKIYKQHPEYETVIVCTEHAFSFIELLTARLCGVKTRAAWSHFADYQGRSKIKRRLHFLARPPVRVFGNLFLACSKDAGVWLFGRSVSRKKNFHIIKNAFDLDKFAYNAEKRGAIRAQLGLNGEFTVGVVGRLVPVKNHAFALEIFARIYEAATLVIIGVGEMKDEITAKATQLGIMDKIIFIGTVDNIHDYYQGLDAMLFPSLHEGFGIVALEAQAAGLPVLLSEGVPKEAAVCSLARHMNLSDGAQAWADAVLQMKDIKREKTDLTASGYHINDAAEEFRSVFKGVQNVG
jgi:glycosyltransferase involved in cell wall biosynthesis